MYHIIHVGMSSDDLKKLDALRQAYPELSTRRDILLRLLAEAHANFATGKTSAPKLQLIA
jgi:hypothetical protein